MFKLRKKIGKATANKSGAMAGLRNLSSINLLTSIKGGGHQMKNKLFLFTISLTFAFTACEKDSINKVEQQKPLPQTEEEVFVQSEYNLALRDFALVVGQAVKENAGFRKILIDESKKMITGEYSAIINIIADNSVEATNGADMQLKSGNFTVRNLLTETHKQIANSSSNSISLKSGVSDFINEFLSQNPFLQISMPDEMENCDDKIQPIIAFIPEEGESAVYIPGYDSAKDFKFVALEDETLFDEPLILIDTNERMELIAKGLGNNAIIAWPTDFDPIPFYEAIADLTCDDGGGGFNPPNNTAVPNAPTALQVEFTSPHIKLKWTIPSQGNNNSVYGYKIFRKGPFDDNFGDAIATINGYNNVTYNDHNTTPNFTYDYYVVAYNNIGDSEGSNVIPAKAPEMNPNLKSFEAKVRTNTQVELKWTVDNAQAITSFEMKKRSWYPGRPIPPFSFFKSFGPTERNYVYDVGYSYGAKINYEMKIKYDNNQSESKYDFVQIPYRNPDSPARVSIWVAEVKHSVIKKSQGPPTICVRFLGVNPVNPNVGVEVSPQVFLMFTGRNKHRWNERQLFDAFVTYWQPTNWYDTFTIYAVRTKSSGSWEQDVKVDYKFKANLVDAELGQGKVSDDLTITYTAKAGTDPQPEMGWAYHSYYEVWCETLEFQNYGFKIILDK